MARRNELEITEVRVYPAKKEGNLVAMASVTFNDEFCVTGISVRDGKKGRFISFPSRKTADEEYKDICFPLSKETREYIQDRVINAVEKQLTEK